METALAKPPVSSSAAIALMFAAGALIAVTSLLAKALGLSGDASQGLNPFQVSAGRFVFALAALAVFLSLFPSARPTFTGANWAWHLQRSICGWLGVTSMFAAVARMPVAEATAISFLSPLVAMALSVLLLGERMRLRKLIAACLAVVGALLVLRPGSDAFQAAGLFALAAAAFMGLETIFIKRLSDTEPAARVLLINNTFGAGVSLVVALFVWKPMDAFQWALLVGIGLFMVAGQAVFIQAMKRGEASFVVPAFYSVLLFAALYDFAVFGVVPSGLAIAGAALIILGAVVLALQRRSG